MNAFAEGLVTIVLAVIGLGIISVLVSRNAQTSSVLQAGFSGVGNIMGVAESPVTGASIQYSLGYPSPNEMGYTPGT